MVEIGENMKESNINIIVSNIYKNLSKALLYAEKSYNESVEGNDLSWSNYWHGQIDALNSVLSTFEQELLPVEEVLQNEHTECK